MPGLSPSVRARVRTMTVMKPVVALKRYIDQRRGADPVTLDSTLRAARSLRNDGQTNAAVLLLREALVRCPGKHRVPLQVELYRALVAQGDLDGARHIITVAAGPGNSRAGRVWTALDAGNRDVARAEFESVLGTIVSGRVVPIWLASFDLLADHLVGNLAAVPASGTDAAPPRSGSVYAVSGMGWSGSGAVYDFLRGFHGVEAVTGEARLIEGRHGFRGLLGAAESPDPDAFGAALVDFFRFSLVGVTPCRNYDEFRHVANSRRFVEGRDGLEYAVECQELLRRVCGASAGERVATLRASLPDFAESVARSRLIDQSCVPLLDNVVHVANLELARDLPAWTFFATVRDPRDQFVDNVLNNPNFRRDVRRFVKRYRKMRGVLEEVVATAPNVQVVQFETFVREASVRADLVNALGLTKPRATASFDASTSQRNIGLWKSHRVESEIDLITRELSEHVCSY